MRFAWVLAAMLWAQPAGAVDIKSGLFTGTITSGTATIWRFNTADEIVDLSGLAITLGVDTDTGNPNYIGSFIDAFISIPGAPNPITTGFATKGDSLNPEAVTVQGNLARLNVAYGGTNNNSLALDLSGPLTAGVIQSLAGTIAGSQYSLGPEYIRVRYDLAADFTSGNSRVTGIDIQPVPEPATWALMVIGIGLVGASKRHASLTTVPRRAA